MSETVVWLRHRKSGTRSVHEIPVRVVARTPSGAFVVERIRGNSLLVRRELVAAKNIKPLVEFRAEVRT